MEVLIVSDGLAARVVNIDKIVVYTDAVHFIKDGEGVVEKIRYSFVDITENGVTISEKDEV